MTSREDPRGRPSDGAGATTGRRGTPFPVDVTVARRARTTLALFLAGPLIWTAHFVFVYLVVEAGCTGDGHGLSLFDPPVPTVVTVAATAVAAVGCLLCAWWAYRRWQADQREGSDGPGLEPPDRGGSLAFGGFLLSLLGFVAVLFVGVPALYLSACGP